MRRLHGRRVLGLAAAAARVPTADGCTGVDVGVGADATAASALLPPNRRAAQPRGAAAADEEEDDDEDEPIAPAAAAAAAADTRETGVGATGVVAGRDRPSEAAMAERAAAASRAW